MVGVRLAMMLLALVLALAAAAAVAAAPADPPRLHVVDPGTERAWVAYGDRPAFGYGISPQNLLTKLPPGEARDPDLDFRDFAEWAPPHGVTIVRSYPPSSIVGPRWLDAFERAADDPSRFDLARPNEAYFARLREACATLRDAGVFVHLQLWQAVTWKKDWERCYYHPDRNVNPELARRAGPGAFVVDPASAPALVAHQRAWVRRILDATGDLGNVFYDVMNEIGNGTGVDGAWVEAMLDEIDAWEGEHGLDVLVGLNDEGLDRSATGNSLSNPRLDVAFLDLGRWDEHVEARRRLGKPTFGVRNIDWSPRTGARFYFAGEWDLSIRDEPELHARSRTMYWRMFLAKVQMNAGYADFGRAAYRTGASDAIRPGWLPPPPELPRAFPRLVDVSDRVRETPAPYARVLWAPAADGRPAVAIALLEMAPGETGRHAPEGQLRIEGLAAAHRAAGPVVRIDLGNDVTTTARLGPPRGSDLVLETPAFRDALVIVLGGEMTEAPDRAVTAAEAAAEAGAEPPVAPEAVVVAVRTDRAVLWAKRDPARAGGTYEWRRGTGDVPAGDGGGEGDAAWTVFEPTTSAVLADSGLATGTTYTYAVRALDASGRASAWSPSVRVTPRRPDVLLRLKYLWWRFPGAFLAAGAAIGLLVLGVGVVAWRRRHRRHRHRQRHVV